MTPLTTRLTESHVVGDPGRVWIELRAAEASLGASGLARIANATARNRKLRPKSGDVLLARGVISSSSL